MGNKVKIITKFLIIIVFSIFLLGILSFFSFKEKSEKIDPPKASVNSSKTQIPTEAKVTKIINADTIVIKGEYNVRLLGIDAPKKEEKCYQKAKQKLKNLILNKKVKLEKGKNKNIDQEDRYLRYVFLNGENINLQLVKDGLVASKFSNSSSKYKDKITEAQKKATKNKVGCKWQVKEEKKENNKNSSKNKEKAGPQFEHLTSEKENLKVINACNTDEFTNKEVIVQGKIVQTYQNGSGDVFLNFNHPYPHECFTGIIFYSFYKNRFVEDFREQYSEKTVRVKGKIKKYEKDPEMVIKSPFQIEIAEQKPN